MTTELANYIDKLNICTYVMNNGLILIGKLIFAGEKHVEVQACCVIEPYIDEEDLQQNMIIPLIPHSIDQCSTLYRSHISIETPAAIRLKKEYCDSLLRFQIDIDAEFKGIDDLNSSSIEPIIDFTGFEDRMNF